MIMNLEQSALPTGIVSSVHRPIVRNGIQGYWHAGMLLRRLALTGSLAAWCCCTACGFPFQTVLKRNQIERLTDPLNL
jgi:hypothetical protein